MSALGVRATGVGALTLGCRSWPRSRVQRGHQQSVKSTRSATVALQAQTSAATHDSEVVTKEERS